MRLSRPCEAGAELVLSVNSSNREAARDWGCEVVVVPDDPRSLAGLDETVERLGRRTAFGCESTRFWSRLGSVSPQSLGRYLQVRERYPDAEIMMGIGNLTELTDADSAAINVVLLGFCEELGIRSVLTTQVINWARSSVRRMRSGSAARASLDPASCAPEAFGAAAGDAPRSGRDRTAGRGFGSAGPRNQGRELSRLSFPAAKFTS